MSKFNAAMRCLVGLICLIAGTLQSFSSVAPRDTALLLIGMSMLLFYSAEDALFGRTEQ